VKSLTKLYIQHLYIIYTTKKKYFLKGREKKVTRTKLENVTFSMAGMFCGHKYQF
jgi:hypothetical protein